MSETLAGRGFRRLPKENMTWDRMVERMAKGNHGGAESQELMAQEERHSSLIDALSRIAKDRQSETAANLDDLWTQVLDHLFAVLGLINL